MLIILLVLVAVFVGILAVHGYKQWRVRLLQKIHDNEYNAAVTIWEYGRMVKNEVEAAVRASGGALDFKRLAVPHSPGYNVSLEMIGAYFRVYAVPKKYKRTGTLSFLTDSTLSVRAADRSGQNATPEDDEYRGD
ncbi:MAG TPA: hypothetical protein VKM94_25405 [Blastocatellia bacterium]|nr:hypothetical protein [Blastocatellia bacterium]